ncbi:MAG TPA: hypothetical protein DD856_08425 [Sulfobacillus sp.]|jgi:hypothetical protein|nr:hypothetical protein [Sulfobacillus sp.]
MRVSQIPRIVLVPISDKPPSFAGRTATTLIKIHKKKNFDNEDGFPPHSAEDAPIIIMVGQCATWDHERLKI